MLNQTLSRRAVFAGAMLPIFIGLSGTSRAAPAYKLIVRDNRLFLDITVNGKPVRALLDSAAEATLVDRDFARKIGIVANTTVDARGSGGDTQAGLADGVRIDALDLKLGPLTVGVLDLSDIGRRLLNGPLDVIIGRELFDAARLAININDGTIAVVSRVKEPPGRRFNLVSERGVETFPAIVEGHEPVPCVFDLGNGTDVLVGAQYAKELGLLGDGRAVAQTRGGGIGGEISRSTLVLRSIDIAGQRFENIQAAIDETGSAAKLNVGVAVLRNFNITTDFAKRHLWVSASKR